MKRSRLKRHVPMRRISSKRAAEQNVRAVLRMRMSVLFPVCQVEPSVDLHEKKFRSRGGSPTDEDNVVAVCRRCHDRAHSDKAWADEHGLRISRYEGSNDE